MWNNWVCKNIWRAGWPVTRPSQIKETRGSLVCVCVCVCVCVWSGGAKHGNMHKNRQNCKTLKNEDVLKHTNHRFPGWCTHLVHTHTHTHTHTHIYTHPHTHTNIHIQIYIHTQYYPQVASWNQEKNPKSLIIDPGTHTDTHTHTHTHTHPAMNEVLSREKYLWTRSWMVLNV